MPLDDVVEVSNYVAALEHGLARLREGFPLSNRLIREIHGVLLSRGRGSGKDPGEFRRSQNWIGGSRPGDAVFVPPPHQLVPECMAALERFLHAEGDGLPVLVRAGLAHVQFETIHPFLDGNGRVGRLLITLLLCHAGVLREPLLYLSLYFKQNRTAYYELLDRVRREGDWEAWLAFFLAGVRERRRERCRPPSAWPRCSEPTARGSSRRGAARARPCGCTTRSRRARSRRCRRSAARPAFPSRRLPRPWTCWCSSASRAS